VSYIQSIVMNQGSSSRVLVTCGDLNDVVIAQGIVMDLASAGLPPSVAGIVGLNILSQYDVEFHFLKEQIAFYAVGAANRGDCDMQGLQKLALAPVQYALPGLQVEMGRGRSQLAIIDLGSSLSVTTPSVANSAGATLVRQSHTNPPGP